MDTATNHRHLILSFRHVAMASSDDNTPWKQILESFCK